VAAGVKSVKLGKGDLAVKNYMLLKAGKGNEGADLFVVRV
jgi:hypothetical protein